MRLWSVHPEYLDTKGLLALWREGLLAKNVLEGKTKGYRNHPQLIRFKVAPDPVSAINQYLSFVNDEALRRGYQFDRSKINPDCNPVELTLTTGQLRYETAHLLKKLKVRDPRKFNELNNIESLKPHPLFRIIEGDVEQWEII